MKIANSFTNLPDLQSLAQGPMRFISFTLTVTCALLLSACASAPKAAPSETASSDPRLTRAEAKAEACPQSVLEAGASPEDCACVETELYRLGQDPDALTTHQTNTYKLFGDEAGKRKVAIGVLRLTAFETCGLFDDDHTVDQNL